MQNIMQDMTFKILSLDVSLTCTGFSVWSLTIRENCICSVSILSHGTIALPEGDTDTRCRKLVDSIKSIIDSNGISSVYMEEMSGGFIGNKATAVSLMKIVAACYTLVGFLHSVNIYCRLIHPKTWQSALGITKGQNTKHRSREIANNILASPIASTVHKACKKVLSTGKDANASDAICLGSFVIQQFTQSKFFIPNMVSNDR